MLRRFPLSKADSSDLGRIREKAHPELSTTQAAENPEEKSRIH